MMKSIWKPDYNVSNFMKNLTELEDRDESGGSSTQTTVSTGTAGRSAVARLRLLQLGNQGVDDAGDDGGGAVKSL